MLPLQNHGTEHRPLCAKGCQNRHGKTVVKNIVNFQTITYKK